MKSKICSGLLAPLFLLVLAAWWGGPLLGDQPYLARLEAQAAQGDPEAELELGRAYNLGQGLPVDYAKAAELYRKSAKQGNAKAMHNLGLLYFHGQGVPKDVPKAVQWFQMAAALGLPVSQWELGQLYYFGDSGLPRDYSAAAKWMTLAAEQKNATVPSREAQNALGAMYEDGLGFPKDGEKAVYWYTRAAENGSSRAEGNLGRICVEGILVKKDLAQAYACLKIGADRGDITATKMLEGLLEKKAFSDDQIAQGRRKAAEFEAKHPSP